MSDYRDRRLMRSVAKGDERAIGELYDRHAGLLAVRLRRSGASIEETEDLLQETYVECWRNADTYSGEGPVAAWLWGIAKRKYAMMVRMEARARSREIRATDGHPTPQSDEPDWAAEVDLSVALDSLDSDLRDVFLKHVIEDRSIGDVALDLDIPEGTVKSRLARARTTLRQELA